METRKRKAVGATVTAAVALTAQVAGEAAQPVVESMTCSNIGRNYCPPGPVPQRHAMIEGAARIEARAPGADSLLPATGNMTMSGNAPEVAMGGLDTTGMLPGTPLPLLAPPESVSLG